MTLVFDGRSVVDASTGVVVDESPLAMGGAGSPAVRGDRRAAAAALRMCSGLGEEGCLMAARLAARLSGRRVGKVRITPELAGALAVYAVALWLGSPVAASAARVAAELSGGASPANLLSELGVRVTTSRSRLTVAHASRAASLAGLGDQGSALASRIALAMLRLLPGGPSPRAVAAAAVYIAAWVYGRGLRQEEAARLVGVAVSSMRRALAYTRPEVVIVKRGRVVHSWVYGSHTGAPDCVHVCGGRPSRVEVSARGGRVRVEVACGDSHG